MRENQDRKLLEPRLTVNDDDSEGRETENNRNENMNHCRLINAKSSDVASKQTQRAALKLCSRQVDKYIY
jgi:hypothetical protein